MIKSGKVKSTYSYLLLAILSLFSLCLIFNNNVWFDEAYTISLIQHNYKEVIEILKTDMHPPLYFLTLKLFCDIFGYSIFYTKVFSALGYIAALFIGCTVVKKHFGVELSIIYMLCIGAIPMMLYFSVQQRAYSWCIFFVTLCFIEALLFIEKCKALNCIIFTISALFAAYNHIYALIAVSIIFAFVNFYIFIKKRRLIVKIVISDIIMIIGYSFWILPLLYQTKTASDNFWLTGIEPLSLIVFIIGVVICVAVLYKKPNRTLPVIFSATCILSIQVIGIGVTVFLRPLYIARYCVVVSGVFALLIAFCVTNLNITLKRIIFTILCVLNILSLTVSISFEYDSSLNEFINRFNSKISDTDTFIYCDSSFGIMSYYYPDNRHICTYSEPWFAAFSNVECINKEDINKEVNQTDIIWLVKNTSKKMPEYIVNNFSYKQIDTFKCDFNTFDVYSISLIN